jgi:hypothetical protein
VPLADIVTTDFWFSSIETVPFKFEIISEPELELLDDGDAGLL